MPQNRFAQKDLPGLTIPGISRIAAAIFLVTGQDLQSCQPNLRILLLCDQWVNDRAMNVCETNAATGMVIT